MSKTVRLVQWCPNWGTRTLGGGGVCVMFHGGGGRGRKKPRWPSADIMYVRVLVCVFLYINIYIYEFINKYLQSISRGDVIIRLFLLIKWCVIKKRLKTTALVNQPL
jgi:hypothetical protein